ncbi:hypothetical protein [Clostridioides difficile]|nr:hypothetical protein [Clostridioides difficile]MDI3115325.1 hypothetical protein [Clostridioides difficile]MDK3180089.1 hypothetical protein [Clostridioides difficile]MDV9591265.1 hypothetical protein [Clostridioides difficile]MDV9719851.1 hypothetical protein [Clostridioides difficile]SJN93371.1 Uncharacterised protein [Clostridioides difficile]
MKKLVIILISIISVVSLTACKKSKVTFESNLVKEKEKPSK